MKAFVDRGFSKQDLYDRGLEIVRAFLVLNKLDVPRFACSVDRKSHHFRTGRGTRPDRGYYDRRSMTVHINLAMLRPSVKTPGYSWSYAGHKSDVTPAGVLAHEVGHHVDFESHATWDRRHAFNISGPTITSYAPNIGEDFAEAMRLFLLNPDLLEKGRPQHFAFIKTLGLNPLHQEPWQAVLKHAHPRIQQAARSWIRQGNKT